MVFSIPAGMVLTWQLLAYLEASNCFQFSRIQFWSYIPRSNYSYIMSVLDRQTRSSVVTIFAVICFICLLQMDEVHVFVL